MSILDEVQQGIELFTTISRALEPVARAMFDAARGGQDPFAVLEREDVRDLIADPLQSEVIELVQRMRHGN